MAAVLSEHDQKYLNADQQKQVLALKEQYAAATDPNVKADLNKQAESIRASAGYTGGKDGSGYTQAQPQQTASNPATGQVNGKTAEQMRQDLEDYRYYHQRGTDYQNGYGAAGNVKSQSNMITQQMYQNSQDWHKTDDQAVKDYLHNQNVELEKLLQEFAGGVQSYYDPTTGTWSTDNGNLGYGIADIGPYEEWAKYDISKDYYDYLRTTPDRYYNMWDLRSITNPVQNADGFSGIYSPYEHGAVQNYIGIGASTPRMDFYPYDAIDDGFMDEYSMRPVTDANGNVVYTDDFDKPGVHASAYTQQFMPKIVDGIIQTNDYIMSRPGGGRGTINTDPNASATGGGGGGGGGYGSRYPSASSGSSGSMGGSGKGDYSATLEQMYGEALAAQLAQLEQSYNQNLSDLKSSSVKVDNTYNEQKRQADGQSAQNAAAWREMANAYGLNSGAIGQAALAQNNQRQSDLNTLASAQAQAQAEIEQQRVLLGQQYQLQINQAIAENNQQKAQALYQEAVRMDEKLQQQQQYNSNLMLQYAQMAMQQQQYNSDLALQYAKMAGTGGGSGSNQYIAADQGTEAAFRAALASGDDPYLWLTSKNELKKYGVGDYDRDMLAEKYAIWEKNNTLSDAEFNQLKTSARQYATANQLDRLKSLLTDYDSKLSYQQYQDLYNQLDKAGVM